MITFFVVFGCLFFAAWSLIIGAYAQSTPILFGSIGLAIGWTLAGIALLDLCGDSFLSRIPYRIRFRSDSLESVDYMGNTERVATRVPCVWSSIEHYDSFNPIWTRPGLVANDRNQQGV